MSEINKSLRILLVEDSEDDALLIKHQFTRNGYDISMQRVETAESMSEALTVSDWDAIICDYNLPRFSAAAAMHILKDFEKDLPFIIVSGNIGEENAVNAMKAGAHDYIMKDNMARLIPAVEREVHEAHSRQKRRQAEMALMDSEANYQEIFNAANDAITLHDPVTGIILEANERASEYLGYSRDELIGMRLDQLLSQGEKGDDERIIAWFNKILTTDSEIIELSVRTKNGTVVWTELNVRRTVIRGKDVFLVIGRDISDRKKFSEALAVSEERYRTVVENASDAIIIIVEDRIRFANRRAVELTGYPFDDLLRIPWSELITETPSPNIPPADLSSSEVYTAKRSKLLTRERAEKWIELNQVAIEFDRQPAQLNFIRDVTGQRELEDRLKMAQKMEAIGTLAGGIAHDFNNILSPIMGYTELVMDDLDPGGRAYKNLSQVFNAANRARELVQQILTFSRESEREPTPLRIQLVVNEALKLLRASIPSNIKFDLLIDKNCAPVLADPTQIHQIVMNLCTNAYQAMQEKGGILSVNLHEITVSPENINDYPDLSEGNYVLLSVGDTGHGMERRIMQRIFDPFFTTKEKQHGTGMGLSVVHGIVKQHKGLIDVKSEMGKGSTFKVFLPAHSSDDQVNPTPEEEIPRGNNEHILLVDDEKAILNLLRQLLEELNYRITTCDDSLKAVELVREDPGKFDLVITDQIMPNLTGDLLAKQVFQIRHELPVILCTGFSENLDQEKWRASGIQIVILKPVLKADLAKAVRRVFDT